MQNKTSVGYLIWKRNEGRGHNYAGIVTESLPTGNGVFAWCHITYIIVGALVLVRRCIIILHKGAPSKKIRPCYSSCLSRFLYNQRGVYIMREWYRREVGDTERKIRTKKQGYSLQ